MHVLIIGAGLGGLTLAQSLRKQGISFEVFERDNDKDTRSQGWAIAIHSIIDRLVSSFPSDMPDLREATNHLAPLTLPVQIAMFYPDRTDRVGFEDSPETPIIRAERYRLREWLSTNIDIKWGKRVSRVEHDDHGVTVYFEDGTNAKGDFLVGADGVRSTVRGQLLQKSDDELLKVVPLAAIVGEMSLAGEDFKRQLALGHSAYTLINPSLGFITFVGLHYVLPDAASARYFWMIMMPDTTVGDADHWLQTASQQEKHDYVSNTVTKLPPRFREIFDLTPVEGIRKQPHVWRDLELENIPASRVVIIGDAAHAMTPFRGEGGYHAFIDAMNISETLGRLNVDGKIHDITTVKTAVGDFNSEMLERSVESVRSSRASYEEAKKTVKNRQAFSYALKVLPEADDQLQVTV
ncbi:early conidial development-2 [Phlyctema vagabunda]|uniref:Early conidial development-2 n=1 Tax=Phlyctema vagabunda TaxID=108571 RepID=A0ABR4P2G1_9HELO